MKPQHGSAQQARVSFFISLTRRIAFASALTSALVLESSVAMLAKYLLTRTESVS